MANSRLLYKRLQNFTDSSLDAPLAAEKSELEENLLPGGDGQLKRPSSRQHPVFTVLRILVKYAVIFGCYAAITYLTFEHALRSNRAQQHLIYSPAYEAIEHEAIQYDISMKEMSNLFGTPSPELDQTWEELLRRGHILCEVLRPETDEPELLAAAILITEEEAKHFPKENADHQHLVNVELGNGTYYMAQLNAYHELHCLKRIYRSLYPEYYWPDLSDEDVKMNRVHDGHCLDILRQGVMCRGDVQVVSMRWSDRSAVPDADFTNPHECINWDLLHSWALDRAFTTAFDKGVLVHPTLGPSFPTGQREGLGVYLTESGKAALHID